MKTLVRTDFSTGQSRPYIFGDTAQYSFSMHHREFFENEYNTVEDFLLDFVPSRPTENLLKRIKEEFAKKGEITFCAKGYRGNQRFVFR